MRARLLFVFVATLAGGAMALPANAASPPSVAAPSAAGYDPQSGRFFYLKDADTPRAPASLAKMVTAIIAARRLNAGDDIRISHAAAHAQVDTIDWPESTTFTAEVVMHGMLMESSNGAAIAVAERIAGSTGAFTALMNDEAARIGATHSHFTTPDGWDSPGQVSTARDIALIGAELLRSSWLAGIVRTVEYSTEWPVTGHVTFRTFDPFLVKYPSAIGIKTGFTADAGECLAAAATKGGHTLIVVVLNDSTRVADATRLMDYGFSLFPPAALTSPTASPSALPSTTPARAASVAHKTRANPLRAPARLGLTLLVAAGLAHVVRTGRTRPVKRARVAPAQARVAPIEEAPRRHAVR